MLVTLDGIVTDVNPLQPRNAECSMYLVPSAITKFVTEEKLMLHLQPGTTTEQMLSQPKNA